MSASNAISAVAKSQLLGYAIVGVVGIVAFLVVENAIKSLASAAGDVADKAASAAGAAGTAVLQTAGTFATGTGAITQDTPYQGDGILGSVGAATDKLFGGGLSAFGGWLGNSIYDATHSDASPSLNISNNGANNNPYGGGPNVLYQGAADASPVPAGGGSNALNGTAANPNAQAPLAADFGVNNPLSWD